MFKLRLIQNGVPDEVVTVEGEEVVIGRSPDCDLVIPQPYVSKRHVKILRGLVVVDLGSRNGTFIGKTRVKAAAVLKTNRINLGDEDAVVEIDLVGDDEDTMTAASIDREAVELEAKTANLEKQLEVARAEVADLRRSSAPPREEPLDETAKLDRARIQLESRLHAQREEIARLRAELDGRTPD